MAEISLIVNGEEVRALVDPRMHLADFLRERLRLTATHLRCEQGVCGACTLLIDGEPARSCIAYAVGCQGAKVTTLEGLEDDPVIVALREAFSIEHGLQCGFCTPGMLMTARDIVLRLPHADEWRIRVEISGNLCRCTGYSGIVRAIGRVLEARRSASMSPQSAEFGSARLGPVGAHAVGGPEINYAPRPDKRQIAGDSPSAFDDLGLGSAQPNLEQQLSFEIARPVEQVWNALADLERMAACMPGASLDEPPREGRLKGAVSVRIGPIASRFAGSGRIERDETARSGVIYGAGRDRLSGSRLRAEVVYKARPKTSVETIVDVHFRALLIGPLAQFSRSEIAQNIASRLAQEFARRLEASLAGRQDLPVLATGSLGAGALFFAALGDWIKAKFVNALRRERT